MSLVKWAFVGLVTLPAAEIAMFVLVARMIGSFWAVALFLGTSLLGVLVLRRSGRADLDRFHAALTKDGLRAIHLETPGLATMIGGILLVFPGFITDLTGLLLFLPPFRRWAAAAIGRALRKRQRDRSVVDLTPDQWHQVPDNLIDDGQGRNRTP